MIKFFRHIRQRLLSENKFSKYLLYAVGEIVLVVIGILIALSINNWNEGRKAAKQETELLENIYEDVKYNVETIKSVYTSDSLQNARNKRLLKLLADPNSKYNDTLQVYFGSITRYFVFSPRRTAYEAIKSQGLELIQNKELRSGITQLYDDVYVLNDMVLEFRKTIHLDNRALFNERLFTLDTVEYAAPMDFEKLKTDQKFINTLAYITAEIDNFLSHHKDMQAQTELVKTAILAELKIKEEE